MTPARSDRVRVGVVGAGWWATRVHLPALLAHPNAEVVGVTSLRLEEAKLTAEAFGVPHAFDDHRELLDLELDAVVVSTPHDAHFVPARDALLSGADVLIEKPMVVHPDEGRELVALARDVGLNLHVGYPSLYTSHCRLAREAIAGGKIGEIVLATGMFCSSVLPFYKGEMHGIKDTDALWDPGAAGYSDSARGGGHAHTQLTHCAALLFHVTGLRPDRVTGLASNQGTAVDVCDVFSFDTASGATGTISGTGSVPPGHRAFEEFRIFGTRGSVTLDRVSGQTVIEAANEPVRRPRPLPPDARYPAEATATRLVDARLGRAPVLVSGELGLLVADFLVAGLTSATSGRPEPTRHNRLPTNHQSPARLK